MSDESTVSAEDDAPQPLDAGPRPPRPLPRILAVANQKGGVGKTTTAVNLGACLASSATGCSSSTSIRRATPRPGWDQPPRRRGVDVRRDHERRAARGLRRADRRSGTCSSPRPASTSPAPRSSSSPPSAGSCKLRRALEAVRDDYDFVLIDCPPSLGLLTVNGLAAADEVLVPIQCEYYALEGLGQLLRNVDLVQTNLNPTLEVSAIVLVDVRRPDQARRPGRAGGARRTSATRCAARSCPARSGSPRRRRSGSRSSRSTRRRGAPSPTGSWPRR